MVYSLDLALFYYDLATREIGFMERRLIRVVVVHRYAQYARCCIPGEEIAAAYIVYRGKPYILRLSTPHLILFDYLCRHRDVAQTAAQIAAGLASELFYIHHTSNAKGEAAGRARSSRTAIRKQVERIRDCIKECLTEAHIDLDPKDVLRSERTSSNEVRYSVHASVTWEH